MKPTFVIQSGFATLLLNLFICALYALIPFASFMAFYLQGESDWVQYLFAVIPGLALLLFIGIFLHELYWMLTRRPVAEITHEGIWVYHWNRREFHSWKGVRKYRFRMNKLVRSAGLVEFYDKPGNLLFEIDTSRAKWSRHQLKEVFDQYARCINNNNQPWT